MRSGELRHRVAFYQRQQTPDEGGGVATSYVLHKEVWASLTPLSSSRIAFMRQSGLQATHRLVMRYDQSITSEMVAEFEGRRFRIEGMQNTDERDVELVLTLVELGRDTTENL